MSVVPFPITDEWLKFAVLLHSGHPDKKDHFDILLELWQDKSKEYVLDKLETQSELSSARLAVNPEFLIRRRYLVYEGPMDGNRGFVKRVDEGRYQLKMDPHRLIFEGKVLNGTYGFEESESDELYLVRF